MAVMRDDNDRSEILAQEVLKPLDGGYIEVVCRLIEQDYIWVSEKRLCSSTLTFCEPERDDICS